MAVLLKELSLVGSRSSWSWEETNSEGGRVGRRGPGRSPESPAGPFPPETQHVRLVSGPTLKETRERRLVCRLCLKLKYSLVSRGPQEAKEMGLFLSAGGDQGGFPSGGCGTGMETSSGAGATPAGALGAQRVPLSRICTW